MKEAQHAYQISTIFGLICCVAISVACGSEVDAELIQEAEHHIIGGTDVEDKTFSHVVSLWKADFVTCTGTLISPNLVLTKDDCEADRIGVGMDFDGDDFEYFYIQQTRAHQRFRVFLLTQSVPEQLAQPAKLTAFRRFDVALNQDPHMTLTTMGYGLSSWSPKYTNNDGQRTQEFGKSSRLKAAYIGVLENWEYKEKARKHTTIGYINAAAIDGVTCAGDNGAPVFFFNGSDLELVGIHMQSGSYQPEDNTYSGTCGGAYADIEDNRMLIARVDYDGVRRFLNKELEEAELKQIRSMPEDDNQEQDAAQDASMELPESELPDSEGSES